jgi:hypothetical protein
VAQLPTNTVITESRFDDASIQHSAGSSSQTALADSRFFLVALLLECVTCYYTPLLDTSTFALVATSLWLKPSTFGFQIKSCNSATFFRPSWGVLRHSQAEPGIIESRCYFKCNSMGHWIWLFQLQWLAFTSVSCLFCHRDVTIVVSSCDPSIGLFHFVLKRIGRRIFWF